MKKYIIALGRQYGCGAHEIGTKLSEKLGIPFYNKEIIKRASKDSGIDENLFNFYDEKPTRSFLYNISTDGYIPMTNTGLALEDKIIQYQFDTIKKVADEGSCIIVGRCADYILKDNPNMLSVFLHADEDFRLDRVVNQYGVDSKKALKEIKATDKKRAKFHNFYCDNKWGDASAYDLSINVSTIGIDEAVEIIANCVIKKFSVE